MWPQSLVYGNYTRGSAAVAVGDFNEDNRMDIALANADDDSVTLYFG